MSIVHNTSIVRDGLHRYLDAANTKCYVSPNTFVTDPATNDNWNISNTGAGIFYSNLNGGYFDWDGTTTDYIDIADTGQMPLFSLSAWVYNRSGGDSRHSLLRNYWEIVGTSIQFWSYDFVNTYWRASPSGTVPYDTWTHITTTWDGSVIRHYANAESVWTDSNTSSGTSENLYNIGGYSGRRFLGGLAVLMVHTKTLSIDEITQNFAAHRGRFGV